MINNVRTYEDAGGDETVQSKRIWNSISNFFLLALDPYCILDESVLQDETSTTICDSCIEYPNQAVTTTTPGGGAGTTTETIDFPRYISSKYWKFLN